MCIQTAGKQDIIQAQSFSPALVATLRHDFLMCIAALDWTAQC